MKIFDVFRETPPHELMLFSKSHLQISTVTVSRCICLLRNSISIPKLFFVLDMSDCCTNLALVCYDKVLREGLMSILNVNLNND